MQNLSRKKILFRFFFELRDINIISKEFSIFCFIDMRLNLNLWNFFGQSLYNINTFSAARHLINLD